MLVNVSTRIPYSHRIADLGEATFVNVLMGKQAHTGGITKVNGAPGRISK